MMPIDLRFRLDPEMLKGHRQLMNELYIWVAAGTEDLAVITSEGVIANISPALESVIGRSASELVGSHWHSLVHPDDVSFATHYLQKLRNGQQQQVPSLKLRLLQRAEEYGIVELIGKPDTANGTGCHVGTATPQLMRNVGQTKRSKALTQHIRRNQFLLDLMRAVSTQAASSLTSIHLSTYILGKQTMDLQGQSSLARIEREVRYLSNLVERVQTLVEIDTENIALSIRPISLNRLAQYMATRVMHLAAERNISLVISLSKDLPVVKADDMRLYLAIQEVVDNAIQSIPGAGIVTMRTFERGDFGIIEIQDTGIGVPPDRIARLFESFHGSAQPLLSRGRLGFGLPIARKIIDQHHGTIDMESSPEKGTTVTIAIPLYRS